ncbi:hypothetical protein [Anaerovorax sp. IOR16]|uniref:hypothetical protein n=1 Tax=Anaerovorax sp. IOR16 TaxID=2773458 RepID=UPI0019CFD68D|nr:hypothetical protein [Anaerovorax sp. IOR16]
MKCGVRFCGGCNPRYDRGKVLEEIKESLSEIDFEYACEEETYDVILVIGGCTNCCASYEQFKTKEGVIKMWDSADTKRIIRVIRDLS